MGSWATVTGVGQLGLAVYKAFKAQRAIRHAQRFVDANNGRRSRRRMSNALHTYTDRVMTVGNEAQDVALDLQGGAILAAAFEDIVPFANLGDKVDDLTEACGS